MTSCIGRWAVVVLAVLLPAAVSAQQKFSLEFNVNTSISFFAGDPVPEKVVYQFTGTRGLRILVEVQTEKDFSPKLLLRRNDKTIATSKKMGDARAGWLDAALPDDGTYEIWVVDEGTKPIQRFVIMMRKDQDLRTSRHGSFYLAHADKIHAWLADMATLKRTGDIARFKFTEILYAGQETRSGTPIHSIQYDYELNCAEDTFRRPKAVMRLLGPGNKHQLEEATVSESAAAWAPLKQHGKLKSLVCEPETKIYHLNWPQLEEAVDAYKAAIMRQWGEGELLNPPPTPARAEGTDKRSQIAVGQSINAVLAHRGLRLPASWPSHEYVLTARKGDRFDVQVTGDFRPYLRMKSGNKVLVSTFGALAWGEYGPIGADVEYSGDTEVIIEVTSFEPQGGRYALSVERMPAEEEEQPAAPVTVATLKQACDGGDMTACLSLGLRHVEGTNGATKDAAKAAALFHKACEGRSGSGCFNLGVSHNKKDPKDPAKAAVAFARACDLDFNSGCLSAGVAYTNGNGVVKDQARGAGYLDKACALGLAKGCEYAGTLSKGNGDEENAAELFKKGCAAGGGPSCRMLGSSQLAAGQGFAAMVSFEKALQIDPQDARTYTRRCAAHASNGIADRAIADCTEAIRLDPKGAAFSYALRGVAQLYGGALEKAHADFEQAALLKPDTGQFQLFLDIAARRRGLASPLVQGAKKLDMKKWPAPVVRLFLGELTEAAARDAADDDGPAHTAGQVCEANYFMGELLFSKNQVQAAKGLLQKAATACPAGYIEKDAASAALIWLAEAQKRLDVQAEVERLKTSRDRSKVMAFIERDPSFLPQLAGVRDRLIVEAMAKEAAKLNGTLRGECVDAEFFSVIDDFHQWLLEPRLETLRQLASQPAKEPFRAFKEANVCLYNRAPYFLGAHTRKLLDAKCHDAAQAVNDLKVEMGLHCDLGKEVGGVLLTPTNVEREVQKKNIAFAEELDALED